MAIETITIKDADGAERQVLADAFADAFAQVFKLAFGSDGALALVDAANPLPTTDGGTYDYLTGVAAGNVNVPAGARIKRVIAIPAAGEAVTVKILDKSTMSLPAGWAFDEQIPGMVLGTASTNDVVIGGQAAFYYVSWVL